MGIEQQEDVKAWLKERRKGDFCVTWPDLYVELRYQGVPISFPRHLLQKEPSMRKPDIQWEVKTTEKEFSVERVVKEMLEAGADVFEVRKPGGAAATCVRREVWARYAANQIASHVSNEFAGVYTVSFFGESAPSPHEITVSVLAFIEHRKRELSLIKTTQVGWKLQ